MVKMGELSMYFATIKKKSCLLKGRSNEPPPSPWGRTRDFARQVSAQESGSALTCCYTVLHYCLRSRPRMAQSTVGRGVGGEK